jgi:hypothetical protein
MESVSSVAVIVEFLALAAFACVLPIRTRWWERGDGAGRISYVEK